MIKTMNRPLTSCSSSRSQRQCRIIPALAGALTALRGGFFCAGLIGMSIFSGMATAKPGPIDTQFNDQQILVTLPAPGLTATTPPPTADKLADLIQAQILRARTTGDPRFLGYSEGLFQQWQGTLTDRLRVLRATVQQSLHNFDRARNDLTQVIGTSSDRRQRIQALLMLANLELVQGQYQAAAKYCNQLEQHLPGLIAASCQAQTQARTGQPGTAYKTLKRQVASASNANATSLTWAEGTLCDIAIQLGDPAALVHCRKVLTLQPDDLYIRGQMADWHITQSQYEEAIALTEGYEQVDSLAVLRAIAMKQSGHRDAARLAEALRERFAEAQWRGNLLHQRDFARFQLDIDDDADAALNNARGNWQEQREPLDTRLLLRAAIAAGDQSQLSTTRAWLQDHGQTDARYPETGS